MKQNEKKQAQIGQKICEQMIKDEECILSPLLIQLTTAFMALAIGSIALDLMAKSLQDINLATKD